MLFKRLRKALEDLSPIFDDCEGNGLRYDINTSIGYVNILLDTEDETKNEIKFDIYKIVGTPLTPENEDKTKTYVSELDEETGILSTVSISRNGNVTNTGHADLVAEVINEIDKRLNP